MKHWKSTLRVLLLPALLLLGCQGHTQTAGTASGNGSLGDKTADSSTVAYPVTKTDAEWKADLTAEEYYILRMAYTERAFTSDLLDNKRKGTYVCAGCGSELFRSEHKFDSGTGWPSFDREIAGQVLYTTDYKIGYPRTEEHCATCGGHLGHVFTDGPRETTGKRHCINGIALDFIPDTK